MDRRTAMFLTMMLGGLLPRGLRAQTSGRSSSTKSKLRSQKRIALQPVKSSETEDEPGVESNLKEGEESPANVPIEHGQQWRHYDIAEYVSLRHKSSTPQSAIIEWIFRRTGTTPWHNDHISVLTATRTQLHVLNNANIIKQVDEVVERFTHATDNVLSIRVRFVAAVNPRWRYAVYSRLNQVASGPQGQQIWTLKAEDSASVMTQMQVYQGFKLLADQRIEMVNGQTLKFTTSETRGFTGGLQREAAAGMGFQPKAEQLEEGVVLQLSPLLTFEGDTIDAAISLTANTVKNIHRVRVIAPREIGPSEMSIDVPEVVESRLNQTVKGWPLGQTLLISAGIQPGILLPKNGFLNLRIPGTVPTETELLVFLDAEVGKEEAPARPRSRREDDVE